MRKVIRLLAHFLASGRAVLVCVTFTPLPIQKFSLRTSITSQLEPIRATSDIENIKERMDPLLKEKVKY